MKTNAITILMLLVWLVAVGQTKVRYPDQFQNGWGQWIGQYIEFDQPMYLCDRLNSLLIVAHEPLVMADELAPLNSPTYKSHQAANIEAKISLSGYLPEHQYTRLGSYVLGLKGTVADKGLISISASDAQQMVWSGNPRPTQRPDVGDARLIVCASNLQNFCPIWEGANGARSQKEYERQYAKIINALLNIDADLYGLIEVQEGRAGIEALIKGLNGATAPNRYGYIDDLNTVTTTFVKAGYIYRTDKIKPIYELGLPDPYSVIYSKRQYVQMFEELATGEQFIYSINHFKAKSGAYETSSIRMVNVTNLTSFLENRSHPERDILIMGDLNAYNQEEPVLHLLSKGYENQLLRWGPGGHSYWFKGEKGHLDHAFSSPSMNSQITGAATYPLNADESYLFGYRYTHHESPPSIYRYADHDPIIVGLSLYSDPNACEGVNFSAPMTTGGWDSFSTVNVAGDGLWLHNPTYGATCSGYLYDSSEQDWLISPSIDLSGMEKATLRFDHTINKGNVANLKTSQTLWICTDYQAGMPNNATWSQLTIPTYPTGTNWTFVSSGSIEIPPSYYTATTRLAFRYSSPNKIEAQMWNIKNIELVAQCEANTDVSDCQMPESTWCYADHHQLYITLPSNTPIDVLSMTGQRVYHGSESRITLPYAGCYIVRSGNKSTKVLAY